MSSSCVGSPRPWVKYAVDPLGTTRLPAYMVKRLEDSRWLRWLAPPLLYLVGFGPLLCAMPVGGYMAEARGVDRRWEKTDKVGRIGEVMT